MTSTDQKITSVLLWPFRHDPNIRDFPYCQSIKEMELKTGKTLSPVWIHMYTLPATVNSLAETTPDDWRKATRLQITLPMPDAKHRLKTHTDVQVVLDKVVPGEHTAVVVMAKVGQTQHVLARRIQRTRALPSGRDWLTACPAWHTKQCHHCRQQTKDELALCDHCKWVAYCKTGDCKDKDASSHKPLCEGKNKGDLGTQLFEEFVDFCMEPSGTLPAAHIPAAPTAVTDVDEDTPTPEQKADSSVPSAAGVDKVSEAETTTNLQNLSLSDSSVS